MKVFPIPLRGRRPRAKTAPIRHHCVPPELRRWKQILDNLDAYNGTGKGQKRVR